MLSNVEEGANRMLTRLTPVGTLIQAALGVTMAC